MLLEELHLENFKNYASCSISFSPKLNFIFGGNGNGKTNILEAISLLCYTKSFLFNSEPDCVKYGEPGFGIKGDFVNKVTTKSSVRFTYDKEAVLKELHHSGEKVKKVNEFIGSFPLVVLSPQDLRLTIGTPLERRRNFDLLLSQISKIYLDDLRSYNKAVKQKNSLLRDNLISRKYSQKELRSLLESWNEELLGFGLKIIIRRLDFIEEFRSYLLSCFDKIVGKRYKPVISYQSEAIEEVPSADVNSIKDNLEKLFAEKLDAEIKRGISLAGPHRDNYIFSMEKDGEIFDMRTFASQGEHKTFVVSLKLSEFDYIKENLDHKNTGAPILLLDDVFSELDKSRIRKISKMITGYNQVFLTTTDKEYLEILSEDFDDISSFHITGGTAARVN